MPIIIFENAFFKGDTMKNLKYIFSLALLIPVAVIAQDSSNSDVEEVVVVGSQIKGASITDALPVTVLSADDIEALGVSDGDELVENLVEQGLNFFNEQVSNKKNA